jgi:hypothetical protein
MTGARRDIFGERRWLAPALASLALLVQVLVPQGFMVSADAPAHGLVICTGHGPLLGLADRHGKPVKAPKATADAPCGFAAHGAGAAPPALARLPSPPFEAAARIIVLAFAGAPGRGLAAPPPPSHAPPASTI